MKPGPEPRFWRGMAFAVPASLAMWTGIVAVMASPSGLRHPWLPVRGIRTMKPGPDPLAPARGVVNAFLLSLPFWIVAVFWTVFA